MATHSSTLAWKIAWMEEPGRLQSMGLRRLEHDWATSLSLLTFMHWRRKWQPTPVFLPGEPQGCGSWWAAVHGVAKSWTWLSDFPFTSHFHALGKEMATHSSVLAWRIPGTGEPGWIAQSRTRLKRLSSSSSPAEKLFYQSLNYRGFMRASPTWEKKCPSQAASNLPHEGKEISNSKVSTKSTRAASWYQNLNYGRPHELGMMTMTMPKKLISESFCL